MNTTRSFRFGGSLLLAAAVLSGCDSAVPTACTEVFVVVTVAVVDTLGAPVGDATVISTLARTGDTLYPTTLALLTGGTYVVVDDGSRGKLREAGDTVAVRAQRGTGSNRTATYVFDVPGGCHVRKLSGPDTLTLP
jgi:hypothetical protein